MKSFLLVLVSSLLLALIASQVNAQYFSASDGATVGRIGRETAKQQQAKSSQRSDTLRKLLSGRYFSHVKRMNDLGMLNFDDESSLSSQIQSSESSGEQNRRDEINQLREYLLRHLLNDYLNN